MTLAVDTSMTIAWLFRDERTEQFCGVSPSKAHWSRLSGISKWQMHCARRSGEADATTIMQRAAFDAFGDCRLRSTRIQNVMPGRRPANCPELTI
jgi:hypothetical protein